ncbi:zinc finger protein 431 isoform X2 [Musca domestica]|uniref:Zinc finger protein 431 isoform X2 n=1 Tax=Musca domestica TaxID=7370 RepID=A0ABM3UMB5_MUSDO|nr:zinc finger protein 431 isoform X2 [Musca domestica]
MLKAIGQLPTYENVKCGEIFCVSSPPAVFNVTCILCDQKISLDKYALHFESQHLTLAEESYSLQDLVTNSRSCDVVEIKFEEDPPDDPIKEELSKGNLVEVPALQSICDREASDNEEYLDEDRSLLEILHESKKSHEQKVTKKRRCDKLPKQEVNSSLETSSQLVELSISLAVDNANNELDISKNYSDDDGNGDDDNDDDWLEKRDKKANTRTKAKTTEQRSCEICHRQYTSLKNYNKHMYYSHNIKLYSRKVNYKYHCDGCEKAFRAPRDLRAHTLKCNHNLKSDYNYGGEAKREEIEEDNFNTTEEFQNSINNEAVVQEGEENPLEMLNKNPENNKQEGEEEEQSKPRAKTGKHTQQQQQQNELSCHICHRKYTTIKLHNKHMFAAHQIKILSRKVNYKHKCDECDQVFRIERDLRAHKLKHQKELENASSIITMLPNSEHKERKRGFRAAMSTTETVQMEFMGMMPMPKDDGVANKQVHHNDNQSAVEDNDGAEEDTDWLDDSLVENEPNLESNTKKVNLPCPLCAETFSSTELLCSHVTAMHNIKMYKRKLSYKHQCVECKEKFRNERDLKAHNLKKHTGIVCDICGQKFSQMGNMRRHRIRHTGIKEHKCEECPKEFFTAKELKAHMISHTRIYPHVCEICGKRCRDGGVRSAHMRRHTGERPAKCPVCGKCFFSIHDLNIHSVTHSDERPFSCDICDARFRLRKALRIHKRTHLPAEERKHVCSICGKTFTQAGNLKKHMLIHGAGTS